jgi:uroporphyrinogen-III synthase
VTLIDSTPLRGFTIGVTADRRWEEQAELLRRRGAAVTHGPSIRTLPLGDDAALAEATQRVIEDPPDVLIANTGIGMRAWFAAAETWGIGDALLGALSETHIVARGPKASASIHQAGLAVAAKASSERLDEVLTLLDTINIAGASVAFQLHGAPSPDVIAHLEARQANVIAVPVYQWRMPDDTAPALRLIHATIARKISAVTFTAAPAIANLAIIADDDGVLADLVDAFNSDVAMTCVGPVCAEAAHVIGVPDPLVPERFRLGPMIRILADRLTDSVPSFELAGTTVSLVGVTLRVGDDAIDLTDGEAALLQRLALRPGVIVAKHTLMTEIWPDAHDEHVVEAAAARLRKRLGDLGVAVQAVPRRGYRLNGDVTAV